MIKSLLVVLNLIKFSNCSAGTNGKVPFTMIETVAGKEIVFPSIPAE
ncbi:MAG: hypothetical protein LC127_10650 [Chitinophagales bacterium]|nr:hypothetical protein [Chitinophagales bacterium]